MNSTKTLYDKLWEDHVVRAEDDGTALLYIDRHLVHEVTSPRRLKVYASRVENPGASVRLWQCLIITFRRLIAVWVF